MHQNKGDEPIPAGQVFYDNLILLLILGIVVPTVVYTVWGIVEVLAVPSLPVTP